LAHIIVIPPDTTVSTFSLLALVDYGVTVRGTVGVRQARGIPVFTAGAARYAGLVLRSTPRAAENTWRADGFRRRPLFA
jgi:hypothetical protein